MGKVIPQKVSVTLCMSCGDAFEMEETTNTKAYGVIVLAC